MRLLLWYLVFVFLIGPLLAAPFTGGGSLAMYLTPFALLTGDGVSSTMFVLGWFWLAPALILWSIHQFIRLTVRYHARRYLRPY